MRRNYSGPAFGFQVLVLEFFVVDKSDHEVDETFEPRCDVCFPIYRVAVYRDDINILVKNTVLLGLQAFYEDRLVQTEELQVHLNLDRLVLWDDSEKPVHAVLDFYQGLAILCNPVNFSADEPWERPMLVLNGPCL